MRSKLTPVWQAFIDANPELLLITLTIGALQDRLRDTREQDRDRGSLSIEQAILTATLAAVALALVLTIGAVVRRHQAEIK